MLPKTDHEAWAHPTPTASERLFCVLLSDKLKNITEINFGSLRHRSGIHLVLQGRLWVDSGWFGPYFYAILCYSMLLSMLFNAILVYFVLFYAIL